MIVKDFETLKANIKKLASLKDDLIAKYPNGGEGIIACPVCGEILICGVAESNLEPYGTCRIKGCLEFATYDSKGDLCQ